MSPTRLARAALVPIIPLALLACHRGARAAGMASECAPVAAGAIAVADVPMMAGAFQLTAVATSGVRAGQTATGRLDLRAQDERLQPFPEPGPAATTSQALVGSSTLAAAEVGAVAMGSAASESPTMPGVGVYVAPGPAGRAGSVVMRVGDRSNARGMQAFDAGYFAFHVQRVSAEGFQGVWMSGDGREEVARGHFCAVKQTR